MPGRSIELREQPLPGVGQRFEIDLIDGRRLVVVAARDGRRSVAVADPAGGDVDAARHLLELSSQEAVMVGALLLGARFSVDVSNDDRYDGDTVTVETITVPDGARSIGRSVAEVLAPVGKDLAVLGIVRDRTPQLVEANSQAPLASGDRVVVASRPARVTEVLDLLSGT